MPIVMFFLFNVFPLQPMNAQENDSKGFSIRYTATQLAHEAVNKLSDKSLQNLTTNYSEMILQNLTLHKETSKSKDILASLYKEELYQSLIADLYTIHKSLNPNDSKEKWFSKDWLLNDYVEKKLGEKIEDNITYNYDQKFERIFDSTRIFAAKKQLEQLSFSIYPSVQEVENLYRSSWSLQSMNQLNEKLVNRMGNGKAILDENKPKLKSQAGEVIEDAKEQFIEQLDALNDYISESIIIESEIAKELTKNVDAAISQMKSNATSDRQIYNVFPIVNAAIPDSAKNFEVSRYINFYENFNHQVEPIVLKEMIEGNLSAHQNFDQSLIACSQNRFPHSIKVTTTAYSKQIGNSNEASIFKEKIQKLAKSQKTKSALLPTLKRKIRGTLHLLRGEIAQQQLGNHFPLIENGEWAVPENILKRIDEKSFGVSSYEDCINLPNITRSGVPYNHKTLFEETRNKLLAKVSKLLAEGEKAWEGQDDIVKKYQNQFEREIIANPNKYTVNQWIKIYTDSVENSWLRDRVATIWRGNTQAPQNVISKYSPLFGNTKSEVEKNVKKNFEVAVEQQEKRRERDRRFSEEEAKKGSEGQTDNVSGIKGTAVPGGEQSVENEEKGGAQNTPGIGGVFDLLKRIPVWLIWLIILLLCLLILSQVFSSNRFGWSGYVLTVENLENATQHFNEIVGKSPDKTTDNEAVYKLDGRKKFIIKKV